MKGFLFAQYIEVIFCTTIMELKNLEIYHGVKGSLSTSVSKIGSIHRNKSFYPSINIQSVVVNRRFWDSFLLATF